MTFQLVFQVVLHDLDTSRGTEIVRMAARKYVKRLSKVTDRFIIYFMLIHT